MGYRNVTVHFVGGPLHGLDKVLDNAPPTHRVALSAGPWPYAYGEVKYTRIERLPKDVVRDEWYEIYVAETPVPAKLTPAERIERAQQELEAAKAELETQLWKVEWQAAPRQWAHVGDPSFPSREAAEKEADRRAQRNCISRAQYRVVPAT